MGCFGLCKKFIHKSSSDGNATKFRSFTYGEMKAASRGFRPDCFLGEGGFGKVYKGRLGKTGQVVAIKQLDTDGTQGDREFMVELLTLQLVDHPNLVNLIGYCSEADQRMLVYEFMPLGSLENHLHDILPKTKVLDWHTRMRIAAGAAKGLEYLHNKVKPRMIYRDLKCSNILLDEGYNAKLSDFGLTKIVPTGDISQVSTRVMGTYGYCAPEYISTGRVSFKADIYSFGVVLLELITGRKALDLTRPSNEQYLVTWARPLFKDRRNYVHMADPLLEGRFPRRGLFQVLAIAAMCVQEQPSMRPAVSEMIASLSYLASPEYNPHPQTQLQHSEVQCS